MRNARRNSNRDQILLSEVVMVRGEVRKLAQREWSDQAVQMLWRQRWRQLCRIHRGLVFQRPDGQLM